MDRIRRAVALPHNAYVPLDRVILPPDWRPSVPRLFRHSSLGPAGRLVTASSAVIFEPRFEPVHLPAARSRSWAHGLLPKASCSAGRRYVGGLTEAGSKRQSGRHLRCSPPFAALRQQLDEHSDGRSRWPAWPPVATMAPPAAQRCTSHRGVESSSARVRLGSQLRAFTLLAAYLQNFRTGVLVGWGC